MGNYLKLLLYDIKRIWTGLDFTQKIIISALVVITVFAGAYFAGKATEPNWSVLYSDLNEPDVVAIVENLKKGGYPYKLSDDKKAIFVPASVKEDLRLMIAENDIIQDSNPGFELLDKMNFGATDFHNKMTRQRIFQGELTRTIERISGIRKARVQIAEPERSVFEDNDESPSASVMLVLEPGYRLKTPQVTAIKNLVAYSVPRLKPEKVFITDQNGNNLSEDLSKNSTDIESYKTNYEEKTAKKITEVLEQIVGRGNVNVQVSAEMNFDSARATIETYKPINEDGAGVLSSSQTEQEIYENGANRVIVKKENENGEEEVVEDEATKDENKKTKRLNYQKTKAYNNYNVSKEIRQVVYAPGEVKRLTVGIALNKVLTSSEKEELTNLIASSGGVNFERGDVINITSMQFAQTDAENQAKLLEEVQKQSMTDMIVGKLAPMAVILILGITALVIINNMIKKPLEGYEVTTGSSPKSFPEIGADEDATGLLDIEMPPLIETKLDPQLEKMKTELNDMILSDPADAARLILTFIKE